MDKKVGSCCQVYPPLPHDPGMWRGSACELLLGGRIDLGWLRSSSVGPMVMVSQQDDWLVWNMTFIVSMYWELIIPTDELIVFRGVETFETTNQMMVLGCFRGKKTVGQDVQAPRWRNRRWETKKQIMWHSHQKMIKTEYKTYNT